MKLTIEGLFKIRVWDESGKLKEDISTPNTLTRRGAIELLGRMARAPIVEVEGNQINDAFSIRSPGIGAILEADFVALDRADRFQYYDTGNNPVIALGDNRQWNHFLSGVGLDDVDFTTGPTPLPALTDTKPNPMPNEVTAVITFKLNTAQIWRGLYISHFRTDGTNQFIEAVLASSVLASPLELGSKDTVEISWTLKLIPTFA